MANQQYLPWTASWLKNKHLFCLCHLIFLDVLVTALKPNILMPQCFGKDTVLPVFLVGVATRGNPHAFLDWLGSLVTGATAPLLAQRKGDEASQGTCRQNERKKA